VRHFRRAIALQAIAYWSCQELGLALQKLDQWDEAEVAFRHGLDIPPGQQWLVYHLSLLLLRRTRTAESLDLLIDAGTDGRLEQAPKLPSIEPYIRSWLATDERIKTLRQIVERWPEQRDYLLLFSYLLSTRGDFTAATECLHKERMRYWTKQRPDPSLVADANQTNPSFLIIGQAKAGTTGLFEQLLRHPGISAPLVKEIHYWSDFPDAGLDWYLAHFPPLPPDCSKISGEASVEYLHHPSAPAAIARELPQIRLICLLREPVARAYSEYQMFRRLGWEQRNWAEVIDTELAALDNCPLDPAQLEKATNRLTASYLLRSAALPLLLRWSALFPDRQILILQNSALRHAREQTLNRVYRHLSLAPVATSARASVNQGYYAPMDVKQAARLHDWYSDHQQALQHFLDEFPT
jgi:hypothetical protein